MRGQYGLVKELQRRTAPWRVGGAASAAYRAQFEDGNSLVKLFFDVEAYGTSSFLGYRISC